jgi:hypothetical protein
MTAFNTLTNGLSARNAFKEEILSLSTTLLAASEWKKFVVGLDEIGGLLSRYDPAPSPLMASFDLRGQDFPTYFFSAFSVTQDVEKSLQIYKAVKSLVRYILFMDRYYEVGDRKCLYVAKGIMRDIKNQFPGGHAHYSVDFSFKQFWPFWEYEQTVKRLMLKGDQEFGYRELRHFNLFKSSDAPIIYCNLLDNELPTSVFNQDAAKVFHYNQALLDIYDDFVDIEQDLLDRMPNLFVLSALSANRPDKLFSSTRANDRLKIRERILSGDQSTIELIESLVNDHLRLVRQTNLPDEFTFLKHLARSYADNVLTALNPSSKRQ